MSTTHASPRQTFESLQAGLEREGASLAVSQVDVGRGAALLRAMTWYNTLAKLGLAIPLVVLHDVGCVLTGIGSPSKRVRGPDPSLEVFRAFLADLATTSLARGSGGWKHKDSMVAMVLARVLQAAAPHVPLEGRMIRPHLLPEDVLQIARLDPERAHAKFGHEHAGYWMHAVAHHQLVVVLSAEQTDENVLKLLGLFRSAEAPSGLELVDLYGMMTAHGLADVVDFSMELLPSVLEVKREGGQQAFSIDGYASIGRRGNADDMILTQLAFDDEEFERRLLEQDLLYFTHERQSENEQREHEVLIDGSASMRGVREVFARGLALALSKRLALQGDPVRLRFFDARLHDGVAVTPSGAAEVPYALQFRAERGRHYAKVSRQLVNELSLPRRRRRRQYVYFINHGECQFPLVDVDALVERAYVHGVYVLPSGPLNLAYTTRLHRCHVVDAKALSVSQRAASARGILADVQAGLRRGGAA